MVKRAILVIPTLVLIAVSGWASDNTGSCIDIPTILSWLPDPPPPSPPGPGWVPGFTPGSWLSPSQAKPDTGVVDVSQQTIAAPIMAAPAIVGAPAVYTALSSLIADQVLASTIAARTLTWAAPAVVFGGTYQDANVSISIDPGALAAAGEGAQVVGTPGILTQIAVAIYNYGLTSASEISLDFSVPGSPAAQAGSSFIKNLAFWTLQRIINSGQVPQGWLINGVPMNMDQLNQLLNELGGFSLNTQPGNSQTGNNVAIDQNGNVLPIISPSTDFSSAIAEASINGGGAAGDGGSGSNVYDSGDGSLGSPGGGCSGGTT